LPDNPLCIHFANARYFHQVFFFLLKHAFHTADISNQVSGVTAPIPGISEIAIL
jgi:hypothetical protein